MMRLRQWQPGPQRVLVVAVAVGLLSLAAAPVPIPSSQAASPFTVASHGRTAVAVGRSCSDPCSAEALLLPRRGVPVHPGGTVVLTSPRSAPVTRLYLDDKSFAPGRCGGCGVIGPAIPLDGSGMRYKVTLPNDLRDVEGLSIFQDPGSGETFTALARLTPHRHRARAR